VPQVTLKPLMVRLLWLGGSCTFVVGIGSAKCGAIAVIVVNSEPKQYHNVRGGCNYYDTAISVSSSIGESIISQKKNGVVNIKIQLDSNQFVNSDGDFDNGIIAHEYGHGISTRLAEESKF
jgi:hypothetical protein